jgi:succinate dehydrogenase/fumarate reductase flavoprotein subunit
LRKELKKRSNVELMEDVLITNFIKTEDRISGATALDITTGQFFLIEPNSIILATGGVAGELYPYTSNNPFGISTHATGTGHAMAFLAGAELIDMEMIQFVPVPVENRCLNLRYFPEFWKGPYINRHGDIIESNIGQYLGESYSPYFVRKIFNVIEKGDGPIYIDRRNMGLEDWDFPISSMIRRRRFIRSLGIDPFENKIQITIGSHFCMGGIKVNSKCETSIPGLYAAGEVMGGVHGGVRLPGCSFAQMIVFGFEAGKEASKFAKENERPKKLATQEVIKEEKRVFGFFENRKELFSLGDIKKQLKDLMKEYVFVSREKNGLKKAINEIKLLKEKALRIKIPAFRKFNIDWINSIEFLSSIQCAEIIAESALFREETRGFHYRHDFPKKKDIPEHTLARFEDGKIVLSSFPVFLERMKPEEN